jgi:hypothetical protein
VIGGHGYRAIVAADVEIGEAAFPAARLVHREEEVDVGLVEGRAVDQHLLVAQLQRVAGQPDDPLDEVAIRLLGVLEDDDVTPADRVDRQQRPFGRAEGRREDELVHQQVIADEQVVLHRAGGDLEGLDDEGADEQRQDDRHADRFEVFARRRLAVRCHRDCGVGLHLDCHLHFLPST